MHNKTRRKRFALIALVLLASVLFLATFFRADAVASALIDFETITTGGLPGGKVTTQFTDMGVTFLPVTAIDLAQFTGIPNFSHSGKIGLVLCEGVENCRSPLDVSFTAPQQRIKVWVGFSGKLLTSEHVIMRGFDGSGNHVTASFVTLGPSSGPIPIRIPLEITAPPSRVITRVTVGFIRAELSGGMFNNGLSIDDLEFDTVGPPPVCPVAQAPFFTLNKPSSGQVVIHNVLTVEGNLPAANQDATLRIDVYGQGQTRTFGPVPVSPGQISVPNIGDLLFAGSNSLVFTVKDCGGSYSVQRTVLYRSDVTHTPIMVIDENNVPVRAAEIYLGTSLAGRTDQNGVFNAVPALLDGTRVIARKMITESTTYRRYHNVGSFQDWKSRTYISNLAVNNDGTVSAYSVKLGPNPLAHQVIRVLRRNTLIGVHLVATMEWDASAPEMELVKQRIIDASWFLYNATDGQILIEQAEVLDDARDWFDADIRIYANRSLRANVDSPLGGFFEKSFINGSSWIHMNRVPSAYVLAHEFGHYGISLDDEYEDNSTWTKCTSRVTDDRDTNPYRVKAPQGSCMMFTGAPKLCSNHPENRHLKSTEQGDDSCWQTTASKFGDSNNRWSIQTPDTRGVIPGQINGGFWPTNLWATRVTMNNAPRPNLCAPTLYKVTNPDGTPIKGREVRLFTDYFGNYLNQGQTDAAGQIMVTGMHIGDRVNAEKVGSCVPIARSTSPRPQNGASFQMISFLEPGAGLGPNPPQQIIEQPPAFNIFTEVRPSNRDDAEIHVRVQAPSGLPLTLDKPPIVKAYLRDREVLTIPMSDQASRSSYVGTFRKLPIDGEIEIEVIATDRNGKVETTIGQFVIGRIDPAQNSKLFSANGHLLLRIPQGVLPAGDRISIGPASVLPPTLPRGYEIVSGPFAVWWSPDNCLPRFGNLSFQLGQPGEESGMSGYVRESFRVLRYDPGMRRWEQIGETIHPEPIDVVSFRTSQLGNFVLIAQREPKAMRLSRWQ